MKSLKLFFLLAIGSLSLGAAAQNYSVNGVVIDSKGHGVVGATIRTDKSKVSVMTTEGGVFSLRATPRDKKLRLVMNRATVMEKELSETIAKTPIAFELDEQTDPAVVGYRVGDTYYPGTADRNLEEIINKLLPGYRCLGELAVKGVDRYLIHIDGSVATTLPSLLSSSRIHSVKVSQDGNAHIYQTKGAVRVITKEYYNSMDKNTVFTPSRDTIRGQVTDGWGRPAPDLKITTPSGETTVTNDSGYYAIRVTKKDKFLKCIMPYTEGTTVRIAKENWKQPINLTVILHQNTLRGWRNPDDPMMYHPGDNESWMDIIGMFAGVKYVEDDMKILVYIDRHKKTSLNGGGGPALIVLDGSPIGNDLSLIEPKSVHSVKIIMDNAVPLYGTEAQCGAIEVVTKGMNNIAPVALADFDGQKAKRKGGVEGMKEYIAMQGKNIEYHEDGYIMIDGKRCGLYIINDDKFTHMRGIEVDMIDEIMIVRSGVEGSYGPRAKNGVVLISASQKEKKVVDEDGNTVSKKEYKKSQKDKKK